MIKIQYIKLLALRGVTELVGETVGMAVKRTGGDATQKELVQVNKESMEYYLHKFIEEEKKNAELTKKNSELEYQIEKLEERDEWLSCLEQAGVDNWEGFGIAKDILNREEE